MDLGIVLQLVFVSSQLDVNLFFFPKLRFIEVISVALSDRLFFFNLRVFYFISSIYVSLHRRLNHFS